MYRFFIIILCTVFSVTVLSQDTINRFDHLGKRDGFWRKLDSLGQKVYEGQFHGGIPHGEFRYFYPSGSLKTISVFSLQGKRAKSISYFPNGKKMAAGIYLGEKRDSIWQFFSDYDGSLISEETYTSGIKQGIAKTFYPDGVIAESVTWINGKKEGAWEQFFTDGKIKLRGNYSGDEKNGDFLIYFLNGQVMLNGQYRNGHQHGTWIYYSEKGNILKKETFENGKLLKTDEFK